MALARKDIRAKLDDDMHSKLKVICDLDDIDMGDFIEAVLVPVIEKRVHDAISLADRLRRLGLAGNERRVSGIAGNSARSHTGVVE